MRDRGEMPRLTIGAIGGILRMQHRRVAMPTLSQELTPFSQLFPLGGRNQGQLSSSFVLTGFQNMATLFTNCVHNGRALMETIGVKQLRDNLSRILKRVEKGAVVKVLRHGKDVVELRPITKTTEQELLNRLRDKGLLGGGPGEIGPVKTVKNLKPRMPVSDLVIGDRR